jgi:hypothetical protein
MKLMVTQVAIGGEQRANGGTGGIRSHPLQNQALMLEGHTGSGTHKSSLVKQLGVPDQNGNIRKCNVEGEARKHIPKY